VNAKVLCVIESLKNPFAITPRFNHSK